MVDEPAVAEAEFLAEKSYDAADPDQVNKARKKAGRERREELLFVAAIMSRPEGRKWMYDLLAVCNPLGTPLVPGDTHSTYHNMGQQNIGRKLLQDIGEAAPDDYVIMMKEARERK